MDSFLFIILGSIKVFCLCLDVHTVVGEQPGALLRGPGSSRGSESASLAPRPALQAAAPPSGQRSLLCVLRLLIVGAVSPAEGQN